MNRCLKIALVCIFSLALNISHAQFSKGRILVGGSISFSSNTGYASAFTSVKDPTSLSFTPQFGYFLIENLAVGVNASYSRSTGTIVLTDPLTNVVESGSYQSSTFLIGPFARFYIKPGIFVQGDYGIGSNTVKFGASEGSESASRWSANLGYAIFLGDRIAIEPMVGYESKRTKVNSTAPYIANSTGAQTASGLTVKIGFQIYLGKRKD